MTHEEIIAMAREAGFRTGNIDLTVGEPVPFIAPVSGTSCNVEVQRLVALVAEKAAAKEREACVQLVEAVKHCEQDPLLGAPVIARAINECADDLADAIRARGHKEGA